MYPQNCKVQPASSNCHNSGGDKSSDDNSSIDKISVDNSQQQQYQQLWWRSVFQLGWEKGRAQNQLGTI